MKSASIAVYTIGHSTHPIEEFIAMIEGFGVKKLIDVRTIPRSRFNPQYNQEALAKHLGRQNIVYRHMKDLGGLRRPVKDSLNTGWRNGSFRGYADYMQTEEFEKALTDLIEEARRQNVAIMCAEAVPWRCHRSLIADALVGRGIKVLNIMGHKKAASHPLNPMARTQGRRIYYPSAL